MIYDFFFSDLVLVQFSYPMMITHSFFDSVEIDSSEGFLKGGELPVLTVMSAGHALHVYINGQLTGEW